jgi:predicted enzyme related to lactoylglutathione lyase
MSRVRNPGEFCWINILTTDTPGEREFFARLFNWQYIELPGMGHRIQLGGLDIGGIFGLDSPQTPPGTPPGIGVMVRVASADDLSAKAASLGGTGKPAFDIGEQGRMAECVDPVGAMFDLWEPRKSHGMAVNGDEHGAPSWFECITSDVARASKFYIDMFGWTPQTMPENPGYTSFNLGATPVAGMFGIRPDMGAVPPHWGVYFAVDHADAAVDKAKALGATGHVPPRDIPSIGRFAGIKSPRGVHFYVISYLTR